MTAATAFEAVAQSAGGQGGDGGYANNGSKESTGSSVAGASLDLGGGTLRNEGVLANGGASMGRTVINGSLDQTDTASLVVWIN